MFESKIMSLSLYNRILNRSGSSPRCKECNIEIKAGDKYVPKASSRHYCTEHYAVYCIKHAKEKNLI